MVKNYLQLWKPSLKDWRFYVKFLLGIIQIISIIVFLVALAWEKGSSIVWANLSFFTVQSNLLAGIFFLTSAFHHHHEGEGKFDNSEVGKIAVIYLTLTVLIYNFNELLSDHPYKFPDWRFVLSFITKHSVVPIFEIGYVLFFYNHQNARSLKVFSRTWLWWMVIGLFAYLIFFSVVGEIAFVNQWKPWFTNIQNQPTTFVYPFLDWHFGVGFFKNLPPWVECAIMCFATLVGAIGLDYLYTIIVLKIKTKPYQVKIQNQWATQRLSI